jgi:hypothetical protein
VLIRLENQNNSNVEKNNAKSEEDTESIFTKEEIRAMVRSFISAWLRNDLKIHFPTVEEIITGDRIKGKTTSLEEAANRVRVGKNFTTNNISILSGLTPATQAEKQQAMSDMFDDIMAFRCGDRIEGSFGKKEDYDLRLSKIEEHIEAMNNNIQQLIIWYRSLVQPNAK